MVDGNPFGKGRRGDPLSNIRAATLNNAIDAAKAERAQREGITPAYQSFDLPEGIARVSNTTGGDLPQYGILALSDPVIGPADSISEWRDKPNFAGIEPTGDTKPGAFCILQRPAQDGDVGRGLLTGFSIVRLSVGDTPYDFAEAESGNTHSLLNVPSGSARVLYIADEMDVDDGDPEALHTGERWAVVALGAGSAGSSLSLLLVTSLATSHGCCPCTIESVNDSDPPTSTTGGTAALLYDADGFTLRETYYYGVLQDFELGGLPVYAVASIPDASHTVDGTVNLVDQYLGAGDKWLDRIALASSGFPTFPTTPISENANFPNPHGAPKIYVAGSVFSETGFWCSYPAGSVALMYVDSSGDFAVQLDFAGGGGANYVLSAAGFVVGTVPIITGQHYAVKIGATQYDGVSTTLLDGSIVTGGIITGAPTVVPASGTFLGVTFTGGFVTSAPSGAVIVGGGTF